MNQDVKAVWVEALRSGNFAQTNSQLIALDEEDTPNGYCCLGVIMEVRGCQKDEDGQFVNTGRFDLLDETLLLPSSSSDFISPSLGKRWGITPDQQAKLARFNDDGKSFKWIAYYIERYL